MPEFQIVTSDLISCRGHYVDSGSVSFPSAFKSRGDIGYAAVLADPEPNRKPIQRASLITR